MRLNKPNTTVVHKENHASSTPTVTRTIPPTGVISYSDPTIIYLAPTTESTNQDTGLQGSQEKKSPPSTSGGKVYLRHLPSAYFIGTVMILL